MGRGGRRGGGGSRGGHRGGSRHGGASKGRGGGKHGRVSKVDKQFMAEHGEIHPVHTLGEVDDLQENIKRRKIDLTNIPRAPKTFTFRHPVRSSGRDDNEEDGDDDATRDLDEEEEVDIVPNAAYSELMKSIKPRGRYATLLQQMNKEEEQQAKRVGVSDDEDDEDDEEEEDEDDEEADSDDQQDGEEEDGELEDEGSDLEEEEDGDLENDAEDDESAELEDGDEDGDDDDYEDIDDDDEDIDEEDDAEDEEDEEAGDEEEAVSDEDSGSKPLTAITAFVDKDAEEEVTRSELSAGLKAHYDPDLRTEAKVQELSSLIKSIGSKKAKVKTQEFASEHFGTVSVSEGFGQFAKKISKPEKVIATSDLKSRIRWWARQKQSSRVPDPMPQTTDHTAFQAELFGYLNSYKDLYMPQWNYDNAQQIRETYVLHALSHMLKTRSIVVKNNERMAEAREKNKDVELRDHGFTRPRILILVPYRYCAKAIIDIMISMLINPDGTKAERSVKHRKRFNEEFGVDPKEDTVTNNEAFDRQFPGNADDCFRVGVTLTRTTINLYTEFHHSDIIIASPLGLRLIIGVDGASKKQDFDFLSSLEMVIVDQADSFLMQNWSHITHLFEHTNRIPKEQHDVDISRIRQWALEGLAQSFRQTILFSAFPTVEFNALFNKYCANLSGKISCTRVYDGTICQVVTNVSQVFHRISCDQFDELAETRMSYFLEEVFPQFRDDMHKHTMIFIPSYFDFVHLRNHFRREKIEFAQICEYTTRPNVVRARTYVFHGRRPYLMYTERFHYHSRIKVRGIRHIIFYGLPYYPEFYSELINFMERETDISVTIIYSKYEALKLEQVVGTQRARRMLGAEKSVHMFT